MDYGICNEKICQLMNISICRLKNLSITFADCQSVDCVIDTFNKAQIDRLDRFLNLPIVWLTLTDSTICGDEIVPLYPHILDNLWPFLDLSGHLQHSVLFCNMLHFHDFGILLYRCCIHYIIIRYTLWCISHFLHNSYSPIPIHFGSHYSHINVALSADFNLSDYFA